MNLKKMQYINESEILVIGGGLAGCLAAIKARQRGRKVMIVDKGYISRSCQSQFPSGNISVCLPENNKGLWMQETIEGGEYLNDQEWVKIQLEETYPLVEELERWGKEFNETIFGRDDKGDFIRIKVHGDKNTENCLIFGHPLMDTLRMKLIAEKISFFERVMVTDLITDGERVRGAVGFNYRTGETYLFKAKAVILAAAGCGFKFDMWHLNLTGEGQAIAYHAGARLKNLDQSGPPSKGRKHIQRMSGFGGGGVPSAFGTRVVNALGQEFMKQYEPELGARSHRIKKEEAIRKELEEGRGPIYLDYTQIPLDKQNILKKLRPEDFKIFASMGVNPYKEKVIETGDIFERISAPLGTLNEGGGVDIDTRCASRVPGLYAIGDNACAPQQGTHPFGGQNLGFCLTSGNRGARFAVEYIDSTVFTDARERESISLGEKYIDELSLPLTRTRGLTPDEVTRQIQSTLIPYRRVASDKENLQKAIRKAEKIKEEDFPQIKVTDFHGLMKAVEVRSMLLILEGFLKSVLFREESRGAVIRKDFPLTDNINWLKWILAEKRGEEMRVYLQDVPTPYVQPPHSMYPPKHKI